MCFTTKGPLFSHRILLNVSVWKKASAMARSRLICSPVEGEIFVAPPEVVVDNLSITQLMAQSQTNSVLPAINGAQAIDRHTPQAKAMTRRCINVEAESLSRGPMAIVGVTR